MDLRPSKSGELVVTAAGATPSEASALATAYLERRGYRGTLIGSRRRPVKMGIIGYVVWDLRYRVERLTTSVDSAS